MKETETVHKKVYLAFHWAEWRLCTVFHIYMLKSEGFPVLTLKLDFKLELEFKSILYTKSHNRDFWC